MEFPRNNNNHSKERKVVQDQPEMRSVAILSSPSNDYSFGAGPALIGSGTTTRFLESKQAPPLPKKSGIANRNNNNNQLTKSWTVTDDSVEELPEAYLLAPTNAPVLNATAQQVMDRIADCLRQQSIAATFDAEKAMVQAETRDHVRMTIRLFFNNTDKAIIVEVHRRCGCSYVFHQCTDDILNAVQGIPQRPKRNFPAFTIPDCVKQAAAAAAEEQKEQPDEERLALEEDLECALDLWKSGRYDAQLLGMESLMLLSQQKSYGAFCAHSLLCTKGAQEMLLDLVYQTNESDDCDSFEMEHLNLMRRHALTVLANCLEALGESGELSHVLEQNEALRSPGLLDTLVAALTTAEQEPHNAHEAARCLAPLCKYSSSCRERAMDLGATEAVTQALDVGMIRHALLEGASRRLQNEMGFSYR